MHLAIGRLTFNPPTAGFDQLIQNYSLVVAPPEVEVSVGKSLSDKPLALALQRLRVFWID